MNLFSYYILENDSILVALVVVGAGNELYVICVDNCLLELLSEFDVDRMNDITVGAVGIFSGGHNDEKSLSCINNLNVVYCKAVVKGYRDDGFHGALVKEFSDFDVCDLHLLVFLSSDV